MAKQLFYSNNFSINWDAKKNPGDVQRESASKQSIKVQTNQGKWKKGFIGNKASSVPGPHKKKYMSPPGPHKKLGISSWGDFEKHKHKSTYYDAPRGTSKDSGVLTSGVIKKIKSMASKTKGFL